MDISIDRVPRGADVELVVRGRLDAESAGELRHAVATEVRRGIAGIALDLAAVTFLSSAGIRVLFETQREARAAGGDCLVTAVSEPVRKVLELTRLAGVLMRPAAATATVKPAAASPPAADVTAPGVRLLGFEPPPARPLPCRLLGSPAALTGAGASVPRLALAPTDCGIGLGSLADSAAPPLAAGEILAVCGAVYHRPPRPFAAVDYLMGTADLRPEIDMVTGLAWRGLPAGRAGFEPVADAEAVAVGDLAAALLAAADASLLAVVIAAEVHGLVAAELIRPLAEATPTDHPLAGERDSAARWLCFSREPVHVGRTAIVAGVVARGAAGGLADVVAPLGAAAAVGHLHAVVFPHRPLRRTATDLAAVVADLSASEPLAVLHLVADDRPIFGSGASELVRGRCWFAPLAIEGGVA